MRSRLSVTISYLRFSMPATRMRPWLSLPVTKMRPPSYKTFAKIVHV